MLVVMIDVAAVVAAFGDEAVIRLDSVATRKEASLEEASPEGGFARRDFEWLMRVPYLDRGAGHILEVLDMEELSLPKGEHDANSVLLNASTDAL